MTGRRVSSRDVSPKRTVFWVLVASLCLVLCAGVWIGIRGGLAVHHLETAVTAAREAQAALAAADADGAQAAVSLMRDEVHAAEGLTSDPIWAAAESLPWAGHNLAALRDVTTILTTITDEAVSPVVDVAGRLDVQQIVPDGGAIDLGLLLDSRPAVLTADASLKRGLSSAESINREGLIDPLAGAVTQLVSVLASTSAQVDVVARAVDLAPAMLGADGPRNYLVLFQNNAEVRATGGIPGAVALLHVEDGKISLVQQASSGDFPRADAPVLPLPVETQGLYGAITGQYIQDVNLTPQFPLSAQLAREMWRLNFGTEVDGVLSMDPVALSYLLTATGPVTLPTGDVLTSDNVVTTLLSTAYSRYTDPSRQDAFFAGAAATVFSAVSSGNLDASALITALSRAGDERRLYLWSADPAEQARLAETTLAGELPTSTPEQPRFGVYFNDGTASKMDYYLTSQISVGQAVCRRDGRPSWFVDVTVTNNAPADAATSLPDYVTGAGNFGVPPGDIRTNVSVYAPSGGVFVASEVDGQPAAPQTASDSGRSVVQYQNSLSPGQSSTMRLEFLGADAVPDAATRLPVVDSTPLVNPTETKNLKIACE